jgi:bifunctional ADP-heptose synthase (sugar kinase/adenylyltransferase)
MVIVQLVLRRLNGGILYALSESKDIWSAARFANALAALSVQKIGTIVSMPTREEIDKFLQEVTKCQQIIMRMKHFLMPMRKCREVNMAYLAQVNGIF